MEKQLTNLCFRTFGATLFPCVVIAGVIDDARMLWVPAWLFIAAISSLFAWSNWTKDEGDY